MADIVPVVNVPVSGVKTVTWDSVTESDTPLEILLAGTSTLSGNFSVSGTFGGATVKFQGSNDKLNWFDFEDSSGTVISFTASAAVDFASGMVYFRPVISGGTSQDLKIVGSFRG